jgi:hypothetical protein
MCNFTWGFQYIMCNKNYKLLIIGKFYEQMLFTT